MTELPRIETITLLKIEWKDEQDPKGVVILKPIVAKTPYGKPTLLPFLVSPNSILNDTDQRVSADGSITYLMRPDRTALDGITFTKTIKGVSPEI